MANLPRNDPTAGGPTNRDPTKGTREYPGYEDYSPAGRTKIKAFNDAEGADHLNAGKSDIGKYQKAVKTAISAASGQDTGTPDSSNTTPGYEDTRIEDNSTSVA